MIEVENNDNSAEKPKGVGGQLDERDHEIGGYHFNEGRKGEVNVIGHLAINEGGVTAGGRWGH